MKPTRKICVVCGREIKWRKKWRHTWHQVKYCSRACRKNGLGAVDKAHKKTIMTILHKRSATSSICPSEAARKYLSDCDEDNWRSLLEPARRAARRLAHKGKIKIIQAGVTVDPSHFRGPIRLKLK